ncbi:hypothetical protein [Shewanella glacialipiscicola]|uniref:hypothetical protein n=1 Tax=Shewanella glacialipiscicola TaxID=614069 RepID=UPI003D7BD179
MPKIIIVDANSVGYAGQHSADLKTGDLPTQAIYNTLANLRALKSKHKEANFMYLWDDRAQFRFDLLPDYKGKRENTPEKVKAKEEYHAQQPYIKKLLGYMGIPQLRHAGYEADDLAFYLCKLFVARGYEVVLVTSDKDWLQMLDKNVTWFDPRMDRYCTIETFQEFTGFNTIRKFTDSKSLLGDKSDNIDGISGIGEKACSLIFNKWDSVVDMVKEHRALGGFTKENIGPDFSRFINKMNALCSNQDGLLKQFKRNCQLMDLSLCPPITGLKFEKTSKDPEAFFDLCAELAFQSIMRKRGIWTNTFFEEFIEAA